MPSCADTALSASHDSFEQVCSFLGDREAGSLTHGELEPGLTVDLVSWFGSSTKTHLDLRAVREGDAAGRPIPTSIIEGPCRHLVKDRLNLTGGRRRTRSDDLARVA